jgi:dihydrodipicolinate reductase
MIRKALTGANVRLKADNISIGSVKDGSIFGAHEIIFANHKGEVVAYRHEKGRDGSWRKIWKRYCRRRRC